MILHCPNFYRSDFSVVGDDISLSQTLGFIANTWLLSNPLGHSVLSKSFSPSGANISSNFSFIFQLPSSKIGASSAIYELIGTSGNDIINPVDWIRLKITATKRYTGSINDYNSLAIDVQVITKNLGVKYTLPRYYVSSANFQDVGIIFILSTISGGKCNINIQYNDIYHTESFSYFINNLSI